MLNLRTVVTPHPALSPRRGYPSVALAAFQQLALRRQHCAIVCVFNLVRDCMTLMDYAFVVESASHIRTVNELRMAGTKSAIFESSSERLTDTLSLGRGQGEGSIAVSITIHLIMRTGCQQFETPPLGPPPSDLCAA